MEPKVVALVQESWAKVVPIADAAGKLFYSNLFEAEPGLRALFKGDIDEQAGKLVQMISVAVSKLDEPDVLVPALTQLGKRHVGYGVVPTHYDAVGEALIKTLEQGLGPAFTADVKDAWVSVYSVMTQVMTKQ
jgi:methyl-accepting chemotaxis protein